MATASGTQAVDRAASLLLAVLDAPTPPTFSDLHRESGLAKSTLSRLLSSLERHALVARSDDGVIRPGSAIMRFAQSGRRDDELIALAAPRLAALSEATGETVNLAVVVGNEVEQISQVDSTYLLGSANWVGQRVPLHCSALGKVFLAYGATEMPAGRLARLTPRTITNRAELDTALAGARRRGWAWTDSELEPGLVAVAAPVHAADGSVVAAISVSGPSARLSRQLVPALGERIAREAAVLSADLGYRTDKGKVTVA